METILQTIAETKNPLHHKAIKKAAKELDFLQAAKFRDEIKICSLQRVYPFTEQR